MTSFTYDTTTVSMELNPLHSREWEESKTLNQEFDSEGEPYTYDPDSPNVRVETLTFPAISQTNVQQVEDFINGVVFGRRHVFTWSDMGTDRQARYVAMGYQQISTNYHRLTLTLEVLS